MAENSADLSGSEREQRIAELKAKMQASAKKNKAQSEAPAQAKPVQAKPVAEAVVAEKTVAEKTAVAEATVASTPPAVSTTRAKSNGAATNGAAATAELAQATAIAATSEPVFVEESPEVKARKEMTRREFMTYAWGGALGLLALQGATGLFFFMMPRFKAGEFGGVFFIGPESSMPATDAPPEANVAGKFWLVNTKDEGVKAIYMVCTHLGCLYKWEQANFRFECPCHGSKFTREGYYIEGPAPRSLDTFLVTIENGEVAVDTGKKTLGAPSAESPARAVPV
jgi:cytochrome b6-f complex iron-sulfur subunit